jgi:L-2-hydroxyglutarate oxidase
MQKILVIGSGLVGLATAYQLSRKHPGIEIHILEKEHKIAPHQSTHNSGVIHSGIYYQPGSLRALNCIKGYKMLLDFSKSYDIDHEICGKIILASRESQLPILHKIYATGIENGLSDLKILKGDDIRQIEPYVRGIQAIQVPQTGIIDYEQVANKLAELLVETGAKIHLGFKVNSVQKKGVQWKVSSKNDSINADLLIFCAGLQSDKLAKMAGIDTDIQIIPFRGEYYELKQSSEHLVKHLIYPVPDPAFPFLGVHFTRMVKGGIEAGPNAVLAMKREGYTRWQMDVGEFAEIFAFNGFRKLAAKYWRTGLGEFKRSFSKSAFLKALQGLMPEITAGDIYRGRSGVRAMACNSHGAMVDDYYVVEKEGMIHVLNAPSPAATSCLSIGEHVAQMAAKQL